MRSVRALVAGTLGTGLLLMGIAVVAQEELDLDSLLDDLQSAPVEAEAAVESTEFVTLDPNAVFNAEMELATVADAVETADEMVEASDADMIADESEVDVEVVADATDAAEDVVPEVAEVVVVEEAEPAGPVDELDQSYLVRLAAKEKEGIRKLEEATELLDAGEYEEAVAAFDAALTSIPVREQTIAAREAAMMGRSEASYAYAKSLFKAGDQASLDEAKAALVKSIEEDGATKSSAKLLSKVNSKIAFKADPGNIPPKQRKAVVEKAKTVRSLMKDGRQYLSIGDYDAAEALFEQVLLTDEYNKDAMRYLDKIAVKRSEAYKISRQSAVDSAMTEVSKRWTPPIIDPKTLPVDITEPGDVVRGSSSSTELRNKLDKIIIPTIEFRRAALQDVMDYLMQVSAAYDGSGVNIVIKERGRSSGPAATYESSSSSSSSDSNWGGGGDDLGGFSSAPAASTADDEWGDSFDTEDTGESMNMNSSQQTVTLTLRNVSLHEALKIITELNELKFRVQGNVVMVYPEDMILGNVETRMYPVMPSIIDVIITEDKSSVEDRGSSSGGGGFIEMDTSSKTIERGDVKKFFSSMGVPFPAGTTASYNPTISQLIVSNSPENLEKFERILDKLNVTPAQVEIEARFIEIAETDMQEMGVEWIMNDDMELAVKDSAGSIASSERIVVDADDEGFTKGLRNLVYGSTGVEAGSSVSSSGSSSMGSLLSISSILTNPELTMVLHLLDQKGNSDLLSAPRITTRSGVNAQIQIVQEIIYPTEFETESQSVSIPGGGDNNQQTVVTVTPGAFDTREVGVILNCTPTVGADGYTIDLVMVPEVTEFVDWIQYGSSEAGVSYNIPQPIFSTRKVNTNLVIWDGQTVVMGGLIREDVKNYSDKIPILGDIPLLGYLFKSEGEVSEKRNLMIFVTARLVDPAGKPVHGAEGIAGGSAL